MANALSSNQNNPVGSFYSADTICSMHLEDGVNAGWKTLDDGSDKSYINVCTVSFGTERALYTVTFRPLTPPHTSLSLFLLLTCSS